MPPDDAGLPPELAALTREEFRVAYDAVTSVALAILKSKPRADELVHKTFLKLTTTRRWDPGRATLRDHWLGALKSELSNSYKGIAADTAKKAADRFQREVVGREEHPSPEDANLEHADDEGREQGALAELDRLAARVAKNERLADVLRCRRAGIAKAADIATELKIPVGAVYKANELLQYHLRKMREQDEDSPGSGEQDEVT